MTDSPERHPDRVPDGAPFVARLHQGAQGGRLRTVRAVSTPGGARITLDGREVINFSSNNYLGLANHPAVKEAAIRAIEKYGFGAGSARLLGGTYNPHLRFEEKIADFLGKERGLFFSSGYAANVGLLTALMGKGDTIVADRLIHASLIDGARFCGATLTRFAHNDCGACESLLRAAPTTGRRLLMTEGIFSMDGDRAPLAELADLAEKYNTLFLVDDAHGFGIVGPDGRGTPHEAGVAERVDIHLCTGGKALGAAGGVVAGSPSLIDGLINFSRSFIYSTAIPPAVAAAAEKGLEIVFSTEGDQLRRKLVENINYTVDLIAKLGYAERVGESPIIPVFASRGGEGKMPVDIVAAGEKLLQRGLYLPAIRPPTVPVGTERFRISVTAEHSTADSAALAEGLQTIF